MTVSIPGDTLAEISTMVPDWPLNIIKKVANIHKLHTILCKLVYVA